jgi:pyruvyltransferase
MSYEKLKKTIKKHGMKYTLRKVMNLIIRTGLLHSLGSIRILWFETPEIKNFGDMISPYLIKEITGKTPVLVNEYCFTKYYVISGSIMKRVNRNAVVWGTGILHMKDIFKKPKNVYAVRGPLTRKRFLELGYKCPEVYGDPGLLLPLFYKSISTKEYKIGTIPHYADYNQVKKTTDKNILIINVLKPVEEVIDNIYKCEKTISSSLHGLIISHAYDIPSLWVKFSDNLAGDDSKFHDYLLSVGINPYLPYNLINFVLSQDNLEKIIESERDKIIPSKEIIKNVQNRLLLVCPFKNENEYLRNAQPRNG